MENKVEPYDIYEYTVNNFNSIPEKDQDITLKYLQEIKQIASETTDKMKNAPKMAAIASAAILGDRAKNMKNNDILLFSALYYELKKSGNNLLTIIAERYKKDVVEGYYKASENNNPAPDMVMGLN